MTKAASEQCPICGTTSAVRPKLVLIDEAWVPAPGKDSRLKYFADLRADDVKPQNLRSQPLEQFIDGLYCDTCNKGFVSEEIRARVHRPAFWSGSRFLLIEDRGRRLSGGPAEE